MVSKSLIMSKFKGPLQAERMMMTAGLFIEVINTVIVKNELIK